MGKPEGYPFLRISKQYGLDYGAVLQVAGSLKDTGQADFRLIPGAPVAALIDLAQATETQRLIREGKIDWQTGEPVTNH